MCSNNKEIDIFEPKVIVIIFWVKHDIEKSINYILNYAHLNNDKTMISNIK